MAEAKKTSFIKKVEQEVEKVVTPKEPERHIYKSFRNYTEGIVPSRRQPTTDASGVVFIGSPSKGVKIAFIAGTFEVNEVVANSYKKANGVSYTVAELVKTIESHRNFGTKFVKVYESGKVPTPEQADFAKRADATAAQRLTKAKQGARAR